MTTQHKLSAEIEVKGIKTTTQKYLYFKSELRRLCNITFEDGTYIYKNLESQLFNSMSTEDKGLVDYEILEQETAFSLRAQSSIAKRSRQ